MKLKKNRALIVLMCIAITWLSCDKDDSNLSLTTINKITISDPQVSGTITINLGQYLNLKPVIVQTLSGKEENLEFKWICYNNNPSLSLNAPRIEIATTYELNYLMKADQFILGDPYVFRLAVKDKNSGVSSYFNYNVRIGNQFGRGWLVLEDKAGKGDLSFIFSDYTTQLGIYNDRNTDAITGPKKLEIVPFEVNDDLSAAGKRIYILADQGGQEYNYLLMVKKFNLGYLFFNPPSVLNPSALNFTSVSSFNGVRSSAMGLVFNNGKVHALPQGGFPGQKKFGDILLNPAGNQNYSLAPFAACGPFLSSGTVFAGVVYDNTGKKFYNIPHGVGATTGAGSMQALPASTSDMAIFDMNNTGLTMVNQDSSETVYTWNAIMKDAANTAYLLRFKTNVTATAPVMTLSKKTVTAPNFLTATAYANSTATPHIYYANGNVITRFETSSVTVQDTYALPAGENITAMKYARYSSDNTGAKLGVATWDGTAGKIYFFNVSATGAIGTPIKTVTGFSKVVDFGYKY